MKLTSKYYKNTNHNFPDEGTKTIDENGIVEINDERIAELLVQTGDWDYYDGVEETEEESGEVEEPKEEVEEDERVEQREMSAKEADKQRKLLIKQIDSMQLLELIDFATSAELKGWAGLKKNVTAMRAFLKKNLK